MSNRKKFLTLGCLSLLVITFSISLISSQDKASLVSRNIANEPNHCSEALQTILNSNSTDVFNKYQKFEGGLRDWRKRYSTYVEDLDRLTANSLLSEDIEKIRKKDGWKFLFDRLKRASVAKRQPLTTKELRLIKDFPILKRYYEIVLLGQDLLLNLPHQFSKMILKYTGGPLSLNGLDIDQLGHLSKLGILYNFRIKITGLVQLLSPISLPGRLKGRLPELYQRQWLNPAKELSEADKEFLIKKGHYEIYLKRKEFLKAKGEYHKITQSMHIFKELVYLGSSLYAANHLLRLKSGKVLTPDKFLDEELEDNEIQIIVDQAPFPHLSLRVGERIYSFGVKQLKILNKHEYFLANEMKDILQTRGYLNPESPDNSNKKEDTDFFKSSSTKAQSLMGKMSESIFAQLPHSAVITTLNIDPEERLDLIESLESKTNMFYKNQTGINDCATMIVRELKDNTSIDIPYSIDASPNQVSMYLSSARGEGKLVKEVFQVITQDKERKNFHTYRNSYMAFLESKLFLKFFAHLRASRVYLDKKLTDGELVYWTDSQKEQIENIKKQIGKEFYEDFYNVLVNQSMEKYRNKKLEGSKVLKVLSYREDNLRKKLSIEEFSAQNKTGSFYVRLRSEFLVELMNKELEKLKQYKEEIEK